MRCVIQKLDKTSRNKQGLSHVSGEIYSYRLLDELSLMKRKNPERYGQVKIEE